MLFQEELMLLTHPTFHDKFRLILVDHNQLTPAQELFAQYVDGIFDHHHDEKIHYPLLEAKHKIIARSGSNSTLIAEFILEANHLKISEEISFLLLSAILLDTQNLLHPTVTTKKDIKVAEILKAQSKSLINDQLYEDLLEKRCLVEHLTSEQLLKKDCKLYLDNSFKYAIVSMAKGVEWQVANRSIWQSSLERSLLMQRIDLICILGEEKFSTDRTFIIHTRDLTLQLRIMDHLANLKELLFLEAVLPSEGLLFYKLTKPLSRKLLQPQLKFGKLHSTKETRIE